MRHPVAALLFFLLFNLYPVSARAEQVTSEAEQAADRPEQFICARTAQGEKQDIDRVYGLIIDFWKSTGEAGKLDVLNSCIKAATCLSQKGQQAEAADLLEKAIQENQEALAGDFPHKRSLYGMAGILHSMAGRYEAAQKRLEQALRCEPGTEADKRVQESKIRLHLFSACVELEKYAEARGVVAQVLRDHFFSKQEPPASAFLLSYVATTYDGLNRYECALFFAKLALAHARSESLQGKVGSDVVNALGEFVLLLQQEKADVNPSLVEAFLSTGNSKQLMTDAEYALYARYETISAAVSSLAESDSAWETAAKEYQTWLSDVEAGLK